MPIGEWSEPNLVTVQRLNAVVDLVHERKAAVVQLLYLIVADWFEGSRGRAAV